MRKKVLTDSKLRARQNRAGAGDTNQSAWTEGLQWFSDLFSTRCISTCTHRYDCLAGNRTCICGNVNLRSIYTCINASCSLNDANDFMSEVKEWCDDQYGNSRWLTSSVIYGPPSTSSPRTIVGPAYRPTTTSAVTTPTPALLSSSPVQAGITSVTVSDAVPGSPSISSSRGDQQQDQSWLNDPTDPVSGSNGIPAPSPATVSSQIPASGALGSSPGVAAAATVQPPEPEGFPSQAQDDNNQPLATNVSPGITGSNIRNSNNDDDGSGLAGSAIAGIVVGILFLIAVLAFLLWRYRKKSKRRHMSRLSGPLYPERKNTTGSVAVFHGLNMSLSSIKNTVGLAPSSTASNEAANMKEMPANASTQHYPKLTIIGGPVSSNGSSQNGPFSSKKGEATAELKEGALPEETVLHIPPEQLRLIQELLLSKGPASVTSADGERFLMEQAKNDPRIKAWLETAVRTHYSSISAGSELPYNVKLDHLVDSLGLSAPKEAKSPKRVSEDA